MEPESEPEPEVKPELALTQTWRCTKVRQGMNHEQILNSCNKTKTVFKLDEEIGKGTFGVVYRVYIIQGEKSYKAAVKFATDINKYETLDEADYSRVMSQAGLGPKVYDTYFYEQNGTLNMVIIMEYFDGTVADALESIGWLTIKEKAMIIFDMLTILVEQFKIGLACYDIKINNFVVKKVDEQLIVREIDFGQEHCFLQNYNVEGNIRAGVLGILGIILYFHAGLNLMYSSVQSGTNQLVALEAFYNYPYFPTKQNNERYRIMELIIYVLNMKTDLSFNLRHNFMMYIFSLVVTDEKLENLQITPEMIQRIISFRIKTNSPDVNNVIIEYNKLSSR